MKILVAVDFSQGSRKALAFADKIASKFNTKMILLHVIHDPASAPGFYASKKPGKKVLRNRNEAAHKMMDDFVKKSLPRNRKVEKHIVPGLPAAQIVYIAKKEDVDLIVMGTQGLSGLKRLMIGSVMDKVMRASPIPVLGVPEKGGGRIGKEAKPDAGEEVDAETSVEEAAEDDPPEEALVDTPAEQGGTSAK
jgi:nucleotide-binding universal stress UspA family protein